jgi:hypothetical protein
LGEYFYEIWFDLWFGVFASQRNGG